MISKEKTVTLASSVEKSDLDRLVLIWANKCPNIPDNVELMMIGHFYATSGDAKFAERYDSCAIAVTSIGGDGGGTLNIASEITYGGNRTLGTITKSASGVTFTADT